MNIYVSFAVFAFIILLYWVISELVTILFRFTGLPDEKARFQVMSLLTGTGFTTRESEMILTNSRRRRLAQVTILFGYVFNLTVVSAFVNVLLSLRQSQAENKLVGLMLPLGALALIFIVMRIPTVHAWTDSKLGLVADRFFGLESGNTVMPVDYIGKDIIAQVRLREVPEKLRDKPLAELGLRDREVLVLIVEHEGAQPEAAGAQTEFRAGDRLTVFGPFAAIAETFHAKERFSDD